MSVSDRVVKDICENFPYFLVYFIEVAVTSLIAGGASEWRAPGGGEQH